MNDASLFAGGADVRGSVHKFGYGRVKIDRLVLGAEGRRAILRSQFVVQLDDVDERLRRPKPPTV
jgi:hypothetical protein